jgi:hypothetical protein
MHFMNDANCHQAFLGEMFSWQRLLLIMFAHICFSVEWLKSFVFMAKGLAGRLMTALRLWATALGNNAATLNLLYQTDVCKFLFNKTNRRTNFPNLFWLKNDLYMFRAVPLPLISLRTGLGWNSRSIPALFVS